MSTKPLMLESETVKAVADPYEEIVRLRNEVTDLRHQLAASQEEARQAKGAAFVATSNLRKQLSPLYNALRQVFGELDAISPADNGAPGVPPQSNAKWESWKQRMPGRPAEFIDLLLIHGTMTIRQFMAAAKCGEQSAYKVTSKLGQAGLIVNNGGRFSLKQ